MNRPPNRPKCPAASGIVCVIWKLLGRASVAGVSVALLEGGVSAGGTRLPQLVRGDDEVLAQDRNRDRAADRQEVVEAAVEATLLGQHADGGGTTRGVVGGQRSRIGDVGQLAPAGARPLDLG